MCATGGGEEQRAAHQIVVKSFDSAGLKMLRIRGVQKSEWRNCSPAKGSRCRGQSDNQKLMYLYRSISKDGNGLLHGVSSIYRIYGSYNARWR